MLEKGDFGFFIKSLYRRFLEDLPLNKRIKLTEYVAEIFLQVGEYEKALNIVLEQKNADIFESADYVQKYKILNLLFKIYYKLGDYEKARDVLNTVLKILKEQDDRKRICHVYVKLGNVYAGLNDYNKAFEYFSKAIEIGERGDEKKCLASAYNNIAVYHAAVEKKYDEALIQFQKALSLYETVDSSPSITSSILVNLGSLFKHKKLYEKALDYYQRAHSIAKEHRKYGILARIYKEKAEIYYELGELDISSVFADKALQIFFSVNGYESNRWIAEIYYLQGKILNKQGRSFAEISSKLEEAGRIFREFKAIDSLMDMYTFWVEVALSRGLKDDGRKLLMESLKLAKDNNLEEDVKKIEKRLEYL